MNGDLQWTLVAVPVTRHVPLALADEATAILATQEADTNLLKHLFSF